MGSSQADKAASHDRIVKNAEYEATPSIRHIRVRPTFLVFTSPHASRTCTCWTTAASDMSRGSASWLIEAGPSVSRSTIERLLLSASAWNVLSRSIVWSSMCFSIGAR